MKPELFNELRKLRNEIAHGRHPDPTDVAERLRELGVSVSSSELPALIPTLLRAFGGYGGQYFVPQVLHQVLTDLVEGRSAQLVCDPWAGLGAVVASLQDATHAKKAIAITQDEAEAALGRVLVRNAEWRVGDPIAVLSGLTGEIDVVASIPPFGARRERPMMLTTSTGDSVELKDDLGNLILVAASQKLGADGIGLFLVTPSFFSSPRSVLHSFKALGLGVEAALALPSGSFAPQTNIATYLVIIRRHPVSRMFVAQLSNDPNTNHHIIFNFKQAKQGGRLERGRFIDPLSFRGLESIHIEERVKEAERRFGAPALRLRELASAVNLGRYGDDFTFPKQDNAVFVPLIGISDVRDSLDDLTMKRQNYAQVVIASAMSDARFVARFLNSELGRAIREAGKSGGTIPKLNKQSLLDLRLFVPTTQTQVTMLEIEARIAAEENTLLGLQNNLAELRRQLWSDPGSEPEIDESLRALSARLSGDLKQRTAEQLDQWFETLPFPLASILRAWQATPSQDYRAKQEHLLHFFEAAAEFLSIILLSAFSSRDSLFEEHRGKIAEALREQNLSFQRASFGTWKLVVEYLAKQTRQLLSGDMDSRALCGDIFADATLALPGMLGQNEVVGVLSATNKMRNDWTGHGGVLGQTEAQLRNEQLLGQVHALRKAMADGWADIQLVHALSCRPRRGVFENEIAVLMGSNSEFLKETRSMSVWLDVERLYLAGKDSVRALQLLPFVQVGPSPSSAKNACYFFNRVEKDGLRFVSYHFADQPELRESFEDVPAAVEFLKQA
jgi:hypothetical protein